MKIQTLLALTVFIFLISLPFQKISAQSNHSDAHLAGMLTDPSGGAVAGVQITARSENTPGPHLWSASSAMDGSYALTLPPGQYQVHFARDAFAARDFSVSLSAGESRALNLRLELERLSANVLVTAQVQPVQQQKSVAPTSIITQEDIAQRQAITLSDVLFTEAGVNIARTGPIGGLTTVFLDGGNSTYTKVLIDGTPANEPGGYFNFSNLTLDNVDKVELVHGAESAIYGSDAMSGVIQLFSHRGSTRIPAVQLFAEGGAFASARGGAQISGLLGRFDYSAAGSYTQTDGQGPNDSFLNRSYAGNVGYSFTDTNQLHLTVRSNSSWAGIPGPTLLEPPNLTQYDALQDLTANLSWDFNTGSHWHHHFAGTESRIHDTNADPAIYTATDQFNRAGFYEQSTYSFNRGAIAAGYQYEVENGYPSLITGFHARRNNQGGFLDGRWNPIPRLTLDAGFRVESNTTFGIRVVPRLGASVALRYAHGFWGDTRYRIFYGQGIKEPALEQSFGSDPCFPGNPNLKAEQSRTFNTGIDQYLASDRLRVSASYFDNRFEDMITFANCFPGGPCAVVPPPTCPFGNGTYINTDLAHARGLNFTSEFRLRKWLSLTGNYTYDSTRIVKSANPFGDPALAPGNRLLRRPLNSGSLVLNIFFARVNWNLVGYFSGVRTDSNFVDPTLITNPGYARFDMAASYELARGFSLTARAINLFDKQYQDAIGYLALGRTYLIGGRYTFSGRN
jgi:vitamin B12 transporter